MSGSEIGPGDSYSIPRDVEHGIEILEPGEVLDLLQSTKKGLSIVYNPLIQRMVFSRPLIRMLCF